MRSIAPVIAARLECLLKKISGTNLRWIGEPALEHGLGGTGYPPILAGDPPASARERRVASGGIHASAKCVFIRKSILAITIAAGIFAEIRGHATSRAVPFSVVPPHVLTNYFTAFNAEDVSTNVTTISNDDAIRWLQHNIPRFQCPDREVEELYYFRWWSFRKHVKHTPKGYVITEFLPPVSHAGEFNTISCATGFHLSEGRWLHDETVLNDYIRFWLRSDRGKPPEHFHKFSSWFAAAVWDRYLVQLDRKFIVNLLPDLVADYRRWETERQATNGLFWQFDVRDGMEESISGSRTQKHFRPTINSYMFANARAIANIAELAKKPRLASEFTAKADTLKRLTHSNLWDAQAKFFKVRFETGEFSTAREAIGFVPWMFMLPELNLRSREAWAELNHPQGFSAPFGLTTAERRHPSFRSRGVGTCEWDGAVWPFATSQTLYALANRIRDYPSRRIEAREYFEPFMTYVRSQRANGRPFIGEYLDEVTGDWINRGDRSRYYNHSTFADLLITGVIGLRPRADDVLEIHPLLPADSWDWLCLDQVKYHGRSLAIIWDRDGTRYQRGAGLSVWIDGHEIARESQLTRIIATLP